MGVRNSKWDKALGVRGTFFTKAEQDAGWPEVIRIEPIAALQSNGDAPLRRRFTATMLAACNSDQLPHNIQSLDVLDHYDKVYLGSQIVESFVGGAKRVDRFRQYPVYKAKEYFYVAARDFKAWLAALRDTPSEHIAAWFEAVGAGAAVIDAPVVVAPTPSTSTPAKPKRRYDLSPVIEKAQREVDDPFDTVAVWLKLSDWAQLPKDKRPSPLIGVTGNSIQWGTDPNDDPKELTKKMLRDRLGRQKRQQQPKVKPPLKRVK